MGSDICIENILCLLIVHIYLRRRKLIQKKKKNKTKQTNPLFTPTEWYFGLPAVPSRAKSTRKRHKSGTSLAVPGAGMGKETEA